MPNTARLLTILCALVALAAVAVGCGGVPGNAVAEVDGTAIDKEDFDHWTQVVAKSGQSTSGVPDPPDFVKCVAQKRKTTPAPAKGQPKVTDAQLKDQCKQEYEAVRDQALQVLVSFQWVEGEAEERGIKVSDAEVKKSFDTQVKENFPNKADFQKFLKDSGQTEEDILRRVKLDLLSTKIRDEVIKGKDKVSDAQINDFYEKNQERFAQPERRDLRIVLTKTETKADQARAALAGGGSWKAVAKRFSVDDASKSQGGKLADQAKGTLEKALDKAAFDAKKGQLTGPVKTQFGFYVFEVEKVQKASQQTLEQAKETIRQTLQSQNQQKALDTFVNDFRKKWKERTECREEYMMQDCKNAPEPTPTPSVGGQAPTPAAPE